MGGKSSPVAAITKAVSDVASTGFKGINDVTSGLSLDDNFVTNSLDEVGKIAKPIGEGAAGIVGGIGEGVAKVGQLGTDIVDVATLGQSKRIAEKSARNAARDAAAAQERQTAQRDAELKVRAANTEAGEGSSIILGGKRKKKKGSAVSSGMGLSTGDTGLQV